MNDFISMDISGAGMRAQRQRMKVIAENLANIKTTGPDGPYKRKDVIFEAKAYEDPFADQLQHAVDEAVGVDKNNDKVVHTVATPEIREDNADPIKEYNPGHPFADAQGYVSYPNISTFREMADMIEASRSYEANLAASKTTSDMLMSALELIRK